MCDQTLNETINKKVWKPRPGILKYVAKVCKPRRWWLKFKRCAYWKLSDDFSFLRGYYMQICVQL